MSTNIDVSQLTRKLNPTVQLAYEHGDKNYIWRDIIPMIPTTSTRTEFNKIDTQRKVIAQEVGKSGKYPHVGFGFETQTVDLVNYGVVGEFTERDAMDLMQSNNIDLAAELTATAREAFDLGIEVRVKDEFVKTSNYDSDKVINVSTDSNYDQWDGTDPDIIGNISLAKNLLPYGYEPTDIIIDKDVWQYARSNTNLVRARNMNDGGAGIVTPEQASMPNIFGMRVHVSKEESVELSKDSSNVVTDETSNIYGKSVILLYKPKSIRNDVFHTAIFYGSNSVNGRMATGMSPRVRVKYDDDTRCYKVYLDGLHKIVSPVEKSVAVILTNVIS